MARRNESEEERAARKAAVKAAKAEKRAERQGQGDPAKGQKPCTLCSRPRDLLIRCQVDESGAWHMACGKCWMAASGGEVDGAAGRPHYRYGGLWKNHHKSVSGRNKVPSAARATAGAGRSAAASDETNRRGDCDSNSGQSDSGQGGDGMSGAATSGAAAIGAASREASAGTRALLLREAAECEADDSR
ncbi:hypothetical protein GPECTOR_13g776 [Gonium pectorale]|uniref:Uncharacterized protein n=1 Tax=Gonium pectorale TaxID=33097 RepID=A0A150GN92_GONPE|nr:hypothetical protein GPECTOR_13g776 [Gonium pectorale]|eukprot:KXZ51289.1 hypothetical protein GPECTOR_13g776 [Gonium pectorale]